MSTTDSPGSPYAEDDSPVSTSGTGPQPAGNNPLLDTHSHRIVRFDPHSVSLAAPSTIASPSSDTAVAPPPVQAPAPVKAPARPVAPHAPSVVPTTPAGATAQVVANTAKDATHQVTAAVQQQAQRITVAPRSAIYRGKRFLILYGVLVGLFGTIAALAKRYKYFPADVGIARMLQSPHIRAYQMLMTAVSELGWRWISVGTRASLVTLMWAAGFRMESAFTLSTWSGDILTSLVKTRVLRPRPSPDLVRVIKQLEEASFPSGHVVHYVTFYGFLFYLIFTHLRHRWYRTALLTLLAGIILLVGPSRVYMGQHWPSDVGGAYFVGTLWLGVIIIAYLETKANYTLHSHPPFFVKRAKQLGS